MFQDLWMFAYIFISFSKCKELFIRDFYGKLPLVTIWYFWSSLVEA